MQLSTSIRGNNRHFLKELKMQLPYNPATLFRGIYPKEMKWVCWSVLNTPMFVRRLFIRLQTWEQTQCLYRDEQIKESVPPAHSGMLFSIMNQFLSFMRDEWLSGIQTELEGVALSEISQTCKEKHIWSHSYVGVLKLISWKLRGAWRSPDAEACKEKKKGDEVIISSQ